MAQCQVRSIYSYVIADVTNSVGKSYMIVKLGGIFKTGRTPQDRVHELQTGSSGVIKLMAYSDTIQEKDLHKKYKEYNTHHEWFHLPLNVYNALIKEMGIVTTPGTKGDMNKKLIDDKYYRGESDMGRDVLRCLKCGGYWQISRLQRSYIPCHICSKTMQYVERLEVKLSSLGKAYKRVNIPYGTLGLLIDDKHWIIVDHKNMEIYPTFVKRRFGINLGILLAMSARDGDRVLRILDEDFQDDDMIDTLVNKYFIDTSEKCLFSDPKWYRTILDAEDMSLLDNISPKLNKTG